MQICQYGSLPFSLFEATISNRRVSFPSLSGGTNSTLEPKKAVLEVRAISLDGEVINETKTNVTLAANSVSLSTEKKERRRALVFRSN